MTAPATIKASARLNDGQNEKAMKSTTSSLMILSRRFPRAPLKIRIRAIFASIFLKLNSVWATRIIRRISARVTTRMIRWSIGMPKAIPGLSDCRSTRKSPRTLTGSAKNASAKNLVS